MNIILERIRPWYEKQLCDEQNGFRKDRGTTEGIYTVKRIHQITNRKKQMLFLLFVDLTAAFDHIPRSWLFRSIQLRFADERLPRVFEILEKLYRQTSLTFDQANLTFKTTSGVRQGGPESPILFTLYIDFVMRTFLEKANLKGIEFFQHKFRINLKSLTRDERYLLRDKINGISPLSWSGYADDLVLFLIDKIGLSQSTDLLDDVFVSFGLNINKLKTETMILNYDENEPTIPYPESIIDLKDIPLTNSQQFKYLGCYINQGEPNTGETEINQRIQLATCKFAEMSNILQNMRVNLKTRIKFLNSYVRSRLTYACQNWNPTKNQFDRIDSTYRKFLRRMIRNGFKYVDERNNDYRLMITNDSLHRICGTSDVSEFIKKQQQRYIAHIIRMNVDRNVKQLTFNNDKYVKRGRPIKSLLDQAIENSNLSIDTFCTRAVQRKI